MFSSRVPGRLEVNRLAAAVARLRQAGADVLDLTDSNPTRAALPYPSGLLAPLGSPAGLAYRPEPLGLDGARRAVAGDYARRGLEVAPDRIVLTASTSEAYSVLFRLLCDPGDLVLVPRPGYPLFEPLASLDAVVSAPYDLAYHEGWAPDLAAIEAGLRAGARAVLLVSPNNPTGSYVRAPALAAIVRLCGGTGAAVVLDEVFADYPLDGVPGPEGSLPAHQAALGFSLGGLSKTAGLPQVKLGWMAVTGPAALARAALERLEHICDSYLSVSTPVQEAAASLLAASAPVREAIHARVRANLATLDRLCTAAPACRLLRPEGGWSAVVRVPAVRGEEELVLAILEEARVLVHPGYFYDFAHGAHLVVSLLPPPEPFEEGMRRALARTML